MRKTAALLVSVFLALSLLWGTSPLSAQERVFRFDVEAAIGPDASLTVTEHIGVVAEGKDIRRGIIRSIPTDFTDSEGKKRRASLELLSALLDGSPTEARVSRAGESLEFRLGDPDVLLSFGEHVFTITYMTTGQLGFFETHDELYWNVTGNDWAFPIDRASFRAKLPGKNFGEGFSAIEFYTGKRGAKGQDARVLPDGTVESTTPYFPGEGLTVVFSWPRGIIALPAEPAPVIERWASSPYRMIHLGMPVLLLAVMLLIWLVWGKDPASRPVIPLFEPPAGVEAGFARYVRTMTADDRAFAAMILGMAVKGVLSIHESTLAGEMAARGGNVPSAAGAAMKFLSKLAGKSYRLRLNREKLDGAGLTTDERILADTLFGTTREEVHLSSADRPVIQDAFRLLGKSFRERGRPLLRTNLGKWLGGVVLFELYAVAMIILMAVSGQPRFEPILALISGPFLLLPLALPLPSGKGTLVTKFFVRFFFPAIFLFVAAGACLAGASSGLDVDLLSVPGPLLCVAVLLVFKPLMKVRTEEGARLSESIEGLRMFITAAEKHRLEMLNPPEETPRLFEKLLPYAFALDAADTWADRFQNVLSAAGYSPSWYQGDLNAFTTAAGVAAFTSGFSGAVSSGTRSSGSGGSGSSGGGGGGGGGRGW